MGSAMKPLPGMKLSPVVVEARRRPGIFGDRLNESSHRGLELVEAWLWAKNADREDATGRIV
jgi:hypothetical protein